SMLAWVSARSSAMPERRWAVAAPESGEHPGPAVDALMSLVCGTGRCRLRLTADSVSDEPLAWDGDEPWRFWMQVHEEPIGDCVVTGSLRRGEERVPLAEP